MNWTEANALIADCGMVGSTEIAKVPPPYDRDYPNGWWRFLYGEIGGMPIQLGVLLPLLLSETPSNKVEEWINLNF